jgi:hypothetical protein
MSNPLLSSSSNPRMIEISEIFSNVLPRWLNHELCTKESSMYVTSFFIFWSWFLLMDKHLVMNFIHFPHVAKSFELSKPQFYW